MMNVLSSKSTGVIYVGRLVSSKKVDVLIKAIPLVCKVEPSIVFHIVGDGEQSNELKKYRVISASMKMLCFTDISQIIQN